MEQDPLLGLSDRIRELEEELIRHAGGEPFPNFSAHFQMFRQHFEEARQELAAQRQAEEDARVQAAKAASDAAGKTEPARPPARPNECLGMDYVKELTAQLEAGVQIPDVRTPVPIIVAMLQLAGVGPHDVVCDLGCGDGLIPVVAAQQFGARGIGIENNPLLMDEARINVLRAGVQDRVELRYGDLHQADLKGVTIVTLFLGKKANLRLRDKLRWELRPGARIVSHGFDMGDWKYDRLIAAPDARGPNHRHRLYLWKIPYEPPESVDFSEHWVWGDLGERGN